MGCKTSSAMVKGKIMLDMAFKKNYEKVNDSL